VNRLEKESEKSVRDVVDKLFGIFLQELRKSTKNLSGYSVSRQGFELGREGGIDKHGAMVE
jgi:hypothetical protein